MFSQIDALESEIVALVQNLVRIPSVNTGFMPTGGETAVCEYVHDWLSEYGIPSEVLGKTPERGNIIARIEGRNPGSRLMLMSHTDVVPVEDADKWRFPPFTATVAEGRVYGRGANDCKGLLTAQLIAMMMLARNGVELEHSLTLCSGADEEHGGRYGFGWLAEHHPDKIAAPFAVNEGGGMPIDAAGGLAFGLGIGEKGRLQVEFKIEGVSSHASVPWQGTNALYGLSRILGRIETYEAERDTSSSVFDHLSTFAIEHRPSAENVDEIVAETQHNNPGLASLLRALSRITVTPTIVNGGVKSNSVPESIHLTCDVRTLPSQDEAYLRRELHGIIEGIPGVTYEVDYMAVPNSSDFETELADQIKAATALALEREDIQWVPTISPGFTDSRFTRSLGTVTYGFEGAHPDDDPQLGHSHGTDESVGIKSLVSSAKIMLALACSVCVTLED